MSDYDLIHGVIDMPDNAAKVRAKLWGVYQGKKDGFEVRNHDPLEAEWVDGCTFTEADYEKHGDYVMDMVATCGLLELCEPDDAVEW